MTSHVEAAAAAILQPHSGTRRGFIPTLHVGAVLTPHGSATALTVSARTGAPTGPLSDHLFAETAVAQRRHFAPTFCADCPIVSPHKSSCAAPLSHIAQITQRKWCALRRQIRPAGQHTPEISLDTAALRSGSLGKVKGHKRG